MRLPSSVAPAFAAAVIAGSGTYVGLDRVFGIYDQTADELAELLHLDGDPPPALVSAVKLLRPAYEPIKAVTPSCTEALFPEFSDMLDMNDCLLLPSRVFWSKGAKPIKIKQTMSTGEMWQVSTGSTVWGGGVVLQRYIETLGADFWAGKRVIELGTGTGLGGITAARLGAADVLVTDRDASVLELAEANAGANLGARASSTFRTSLLEWGPAPMDGSSVEPAYTQPWDVVIGADLTYNRDAWPLLVDTIKRLQAPVILTASERRPNELQSLQQFLSEKGLQLDVVQSPMTEGYAARNIRVLRIAKPPPFAKAVLSQAQAPGQMRAAKVPSKSAPARGKTPSGVQAGPSAKEKASELLRYTFNTKEGQLWYEVDTTLKQERLNWAYGEVNKKQYDFNSPPTPPEALLELDVRKPSPSGN